MLLCKLFDHKIAGAHYSKSPKYTRYFSATGGALDGIGRHHIQLYAECDRCGKKFYVGNIHGREDGNILT